MDGMPSFGGPPDMSSSRSMECFDQSVFQAVVPSRFWASAQAVRSIIVTSVARARFNKHPKRCRDIERAGSAMNGRGRSTNRVLPLRCLRRKDVTAKTLAHRAILPTLSSIRPASQFVTQILQAVTVRSALFCLKNPYLWPVPALLFPLCPYNGPTIGGLGVSARTTRSVPARTTTGLMAYQSSPFLGSL